MTVRYQQEGDADTVCAAARQVVEFMRRQGFRATTSISVQVVEDVDGPLHGGELGRYDGIRLETSVLSFDSARRASRDNPPFGISMNRDLYRSFVAHELAHAVAHPEFEIPRPSVVAQEYIAYTVQLATMPEQWRQAAIDRYATAGFSDESEITELYYAFDPNAFGVKAYRHFLTVPDTRAYYRRLLTGEFRPQAPAWW